MFYRGLFRILQWLHTFTYTFMSHCNFQHICSFLIFRSFSCHFRIPLRFYTHTHTHSFHVILNPNRIQRFNGLKMFKSPSAASCYRNWKCTSDCSLWVVYNLSGSVLNITHNYIFSRDITSTALIKSVYVHCILGFKLSPCSLCSMFSFGYFPGVWVLKTDVSEPSIGSIFIGRWMKNG